MTMDIKTCCQWRVTGGQLRNPTSAKTGQIWGTRHSLRIEISLPDRRLPRGSVRNSGWSRDLLFFSPYHRVSRRLVSAKTPRSLVDVVDDNRIPFELHLVVIASRALQIATAVRVCVMSLL